MCTVCIVHMQVSLFFDIFMCLTKDMSAADFEAGRYARTTSVSHSSQDDPLLRKIRASLWLHLVQKHRIKMNASEFHYVVIRTYSLLLIHCDTS